MSEGVLKCICVCVCAHGGFVEAAGQAAAGGDPVVESGWLVHGAQGADAASHGGPRRQSALATLAGDLYALGSG